VAECADIQELLPLYALDALPTETQEEVELHLETCAVCRAAADVELAAVSRLALAVPQFDPSPALRERILGATRLREVEPLRPPASMPVPLAAIRQRRGVRQVPFYWVAVAALVPLMLTAWLGTQVMSLRRSVEATVASEQRALASAEVAADIIGRGLHSGTGGGTAQVVGTDMAPDASGMLYYASNQPEGVLTVAGLPSLPKGQCYQLWLIQNDQWMDGGTFYEGEGKGMLIVKAPMPLSSIDMIRVTMEPHGGSPEPRGNRYLWARLKSS